MGRVVGVVGGVVVVASDERCTLLLLKATHRLW
jgi:hypothetical protein